MRASRFHSEQTNGARRVLARQIELLAYSANAAPRYTKVGNGGGDMIGACPTTANWSSAARRLQALAAVIRKRFVGMFAGGNLATPSTRFIGPARALQTSSTSTRAPGTPDLMVTRTRRGGGSEPTTGYDARTGSAAFKAPLKMR